MLLFKLKNRIRRSFGKTLSVAEIPNLIQVQKNSYEGFLQLDVPAEQRKNKGLEAVFRSVFPISDYDGRATVEYVRYALDTPKYDIEECMQRDVSYAAPLRVTMRLIVWDLDEEIGMKEVKGIKEQDVYIGEIPLMTKNGTFVINGAQRVIVSQMHRSPGVFYYHDGGKSNIAGKYLYFARVIPYRGSWLDFEFDAKDILFFRIDRKRKLYVTTLLKALGYSKDQILGEFYNFRKCLKYGDSWVSDFDLEKLKNSKITKNVIDLRTGKVVIDSGTRLTSKIIQKFGAEDIKNSAVFEDLQGLSVAHSIVDPETGEEIIASGEEITPNILKRIEAIDLKEVHVIDIDNVKVWPYIRNTLMLDKNLTQEDAISDIYRVLRPGEPATAEVATSLFNGIFFDPERYDLSAVGRMKLNAKHEINMPEDYTTLTREDILAIIKYLISVKDGYGEIDDIDSLSNRRVRSVGELVENQFRLGLVRMERAILERMGSVEIDSVMPHDLVNSKALMSVIRDFFGTSQLSQFMDQTNPLSEVTHKRRVSALGPGGLTRERAGFEVRDVHPTHYGRICPIETPEGQNIGLINSLATYARVNKYGFIESPYRKVADGQVTEEITYLSAIEEGRYAIAPANVKLTENKSFIEEIVPCRRRGEGTLAPKSEISYVDVSPKQLVSVAASLIPFLENNDANRALMGSNMQRQAVPSLNSEAPFVGTGMESVVARDSGAVVIAKNSGTVDQVDARRIVVRYKDDQSGVPGVDIYTLNKYKKSNQGTCINQKPIVKVGDFVEKGDVIADGSCTDYGELALGRNVLVAFMPWKGYNFEDSILLSERIVKEDIFTSIHVEEFQVIARDTRLGPEEVTRDIPNVSEENLKYLDEIGIVHVGADVKAGDILVGKVTPKTESPLSAEEKLLRSLFGEKGKDVRDSSLRVPPGVKGVVVGVRVFTRRGIEKDERAIALEKVEIEKVEKDKEDKVSIIKVFAYSRVAELLVGKIIVSAPKPLVPGDVLTQQVFDKLPKRQLWQIVVDDAQNMSELERIKLFYDRSIEELEEELKHKVKKIQSGDDLPHGALKLVKVYLATKLKLQPGDKMAGRHGNKGVVSKILPVEDMPFLEDGTPVDIVLNPLGVPSRMNVGQILETHLGWASVNLGKKISEVLRSINDSSEVSELRKEILNLYPSDRQSDVAVREIIKSMSDESVIELAKTLSKGVPFATPVFDGAKEDEINEMLTKAGVDASGQMTLIDGRTGEKFDRKVTVGYIYMLKLDHLVDNKIHARSTGPYSLITQQPLGGKAHFGGQRFGEMECWGLQAYGAAYTLQEMLTVKSDDVDGRVKIYESIIRGDPIFECGVPESFNVMIKELMSLCLNVEMITDDKDDKDDNED